MGGGAEGMGPTQTIPIFTSFGPFTPDPGIHREVHKTFYTEHYFCFRPVPGQALWGLPRRQEPNSHGLPSLFSRSPLGSSRAPFPPLDQVTGRLGPGAWGGRRRKVERDSLGLHLQGRLSWAPRMRVALPHLKGCPLEKFPAETQIQRSSFYK